MTKIKKIAVGMSGGVDSTMTVYLLKQEGYDIVGITMSVWDNSIDMPDLGISGCYGPGEKKDIEQTKELAKKFGVEHFVIDLKEDYKNNVLKYFCSEYSCGKTPNPCVMCNRKVKFGALIEKAKSTGLDFDIFATGHYARVEYDDKTKRWLLKKAIDDKKDQSYFLAFLSQEQLSKVMFPLGSKTKTEIKNLATELGLKELAEKKESQDFIETDDYSVLFKDKKIEVGAILDINGKKLGTHKGIIHYTIGQRKGLGISTPEPVYVIKIDADNNTIIVGPESFLFSKELKASNINWISINELKTPIRVMAKIRQQHKPAWATVEPINNYDIKITFDEPQRAITAGQTVVLYDEDIVVGAGIIIK